MITCISEASQVAVVLGNNKRRQKLDGTNGRFVGTVNTNQVDKITLVATFGRRKEIELLKYRVGLHESIIETFRGFHGREEGVSDYQTSIK